MAIQHPDIQPAVNHSVQVAIAGAGPVGLMMANYLGLQRLQQSPHSGAMQAAEFRQQPDAGTAIKFI